MTEEKRPLENERITNFPKLMQDIDGGVVSNVLGLALSNVGRAVAASNKQGEITVKIKLKPGGSSDNSFLDLIAGITVNEPKMNFGQKKEDFQYRSIAYVGKGGKLTYDRPKEDVNGQLTFDNQPRKLKEVR
ncbi:MULTISPECIES: hypothetical protein [Salinivibrio]|uniref:Uncharacterized protein n=1 Tax=Salinivibrio proteolyticus TaxID=334715 RepID=A0ABY7LC26_9GAMM|nr:MULTISPECIES: hypothetical protein [Salinivibrio]PCE67574.1 hypothetical protein B6G00_04290 [Salinivibrio sp. YCSC6]QCF35522.1 hypothetical protein E8E00_04670 [Salinivibrio sp. YCSC6]WBA13884.1 hypothetical protein N7E60_09090 [Salinivibrio proteolyticus]